MDATTRFALLAGLALAVLSVPLFAQDTDDSGARSKPKGRAAAKAAASSTEDADDSDSAPKSAAKSTKGKKPADDSAAAGDEPPDIFSITDPKTTDEAWKQWDKGSGRVDYNRRIHAGELGDRDTQQVIANGIRAQIYAMTLPTQRDNLHRIVAEVLRSVHGAADTKDPSTQRLFRESMVKEIVARCRELEDNQFHVRLSAAVILSNLFVMTENPLNRGAAEFYSDAFDALVSVLSKPGQPEAVKIEAVIGLQNAALYGVPQLPPSQRIRLAVKLRDELERPNAGEWYQQRLCEALSSIDQIYDLDGKPFIVHALAKALYDHDRSLCARAAAAKALGRAALPPEADLNVIAYGIADLSRQMVEARNERKKHVRRWCVMDVLLAFKPKDSTENGKRAGLLHRVEEPAFQKYKQTIKDVYALILPMVAQELKETNSDFPPGVLDKIVEWQKSHTPSQMRVAPGLPLIATTQVTRKE